MGRKKKSSNGYFRQTFTYNGKRYSVYAKDQNELTDKILAKKKELEELKENRTNPTIQAYYEEFTEIRRREIKEATIRGQIYQFRNITEVVMQDGIKFGKMRIRDITRRDIEYARQSLLKEGKTPEYLNIVFAHLNHVLETATLDETIDRNPCKALKRLKRENQPISETKHRALTEDETCSFLVCKASVRGKLRLRHAALSGYYRIRRCRGFAVYIRFDFYSFASELALGKSKRLCMAHWTRNLPHHKSVMH